MTLPFTEEQFLAVFATYNSAIWPAQLVAYAFGLVAVAALWVARPQASRLILAGLAVMWAWTGIGYHFLFFSAINPAAKLFAGVFVLQALLLLASAAAARAPSIRIGRDLRCWAGWFTILYAALIYPLLGLWAGHGLMAGPMFGVAPCPTTLFTIGLLLLARGRWVVWLSIIPLLWSGVGFAAAVQLGMLEDLALSAAGLVLLIALVIDAIRTRRGSISPRDFPRPST